MNLSYNQNTVPQVLTADQLAKEAPSIYALTPSATRGERYGFVPTHDILETLAVAGWKPSKALTKNARTEEKRNFGMHIIRLRHENDGLMQLPGDCRMEIVLRNSHDGTSAVHFDVGVFRLVCSNGLVIADKLYGGFKVQHRAYAVERVREGLQGLTQELPRLKDTMADWQRLALSTDEQRLLATSAARLRWTDGDAPVDADTLLTPRRWADRDQSLWTTYNVVQEHVIRGRDRGLVPSDSGRFVRRNAEGVQERVRRVTTRPVTGIEADNRLNRELWALAEGMAKLKGAANAGAEVQS